MIYFIQAGEGGPIKIGRTSNISARLWYLQAASAVELKLIASDPGGSKEEQVYHARFEHIRIRGEWFSPDTELVELCAQIGIASERGTGKRITITVSDELGGRLARLRVAEDRPEAQMVTKLVKEALDAREKRRG